MASTTAAAAVSAAVPAGFHFETRGAVLRFLGLLPWAPRLAAPPGVQHDVASQPLDQEVLLKVKAEIEEELKSLDREISEASPSTGFDWRASPVFSPADPESSVEDCLARLGEGASRELQEPLWQALQTLLSQPVTYQTYRECVLETTAHASGWNKVVVPLVLLQQMLLELTRRGWEPLSTLLQFGVTFLEDHAADFILQQGGWGTIFNLSSEEEADPGVIAEDSNDIYILPSDNSAQASPPESPTITTSWHSGSLPVSLSTSQSWHTESLPVSLGPESWQQVAVDPEDVKSLDSNGAGERSENNSSNSDIVHVEKEEIPEEAGEAGMGAVPVLLLTGGMQETTPETWAPSLPRITALPSLQREPSAREAAAGVSPAPPSFVELEEGGAGPASVGPRAAVGAPMAPVLAPAGALPSEGMRVWLARLLASPVGEQRGTTTLLFGGAAAVAALVVVVGVALALRKK